MNKRSALALYLMVWAVVSEGVIFGMTQAGYPLWAALVFACLFFLLLNGSIAYRHRARQLNLEGKEAPPFLQYILLPKGSPKVEAEVLRYTHLLVGVLASLLGVFLVFCGVALAFDAKWSRIPDPLIAATLCLIPAGIGAALLYLAWRLFSFRRLPKDAA